MGKRRVLITGVSRFLGLRLAKRLEQDDEIERIIGVDLEEPAIPIDRFEFVRVDIRNPLIARVIEATKIDSLVHTNIASSPGRLGGRSQMKENNVIGTMQLLAAAQRSTKIRRVIMRSSSAVYGAAPGEPSIIPEDYASRPVELSGYAKDCSEAEQYARDYGRRRPDVDLAILRTQNVLGPTVRTSLSDYLSLPVVPTGIGFDPRIQVLHEEDAVEALYTALIHDAKGIFNIAGNGVVYLSKALRLLGKPPVPIPTQLALPAAGLLRRFGLVDFPTDQLSLILYGRVIDISRAREVLGFVPRYSTEETILDFRDHRSGEQPPEPSSRPTWERELFEYLRKRSTERESV